MVWGISPYKTLIIPLEDYNADHYLTLLYTAFQNLDWHIGYFDHDGIIAYTDISWESYSEEVSVRVNEQQVIIKSECVGYQALFTDYGKNEKNLELLLAEIEYVDFHLQHNLEQTTQELMDAVPENQFLQLDDPPMAGKEKLHSFLSVFTPQKDYFITPILVLVNIAVYFITTLSIALMIALVAKSGHSGGNIFEKAYLLMGFSNRSLVLQGQVWRLLTNTFMHFSLLHLTGNMIVLIYIGSLLESKLGKWNYLLLYLFTGIMASMVSVIHQTQGIAGGASGAIFGLFGILLALLSTKFYEPNTRRALLISTGIFVAYNIIPSGPSVDYAAHIGGLISGYILGLIAYAGLSHPKQIFRKWGIAVTGLILCLSFITTAMIVTPNYRIKDYSRLNRKVGKLLREIDRDFYKGYNVSREERMDILAHKARPELNDVYKSAAAYEQLPLPSKLKRLAHIQAEIVRQECLFYNLLYKEFRDKDRVKYRPAINKANDEINELHRQWQALENEN